MIKSRRLIWGGHVTRIKEDMSAFKLLTSKPIGKRHLGRPRRRWEDSIRIKLKEIGINTRNLVHLAQDKGYWRVLVNSAMNFRVS